MTQSALTESALSRHEQAETPILGPTKQINTVTASNRYSLFYSVYISDFEEFIDK